MKTITMTIDEILPDESKCPLPLSIIPNNMGINLCAVDKIEWQKQADGQLTYLTIHFRPE